MNEQREIVKASWLQHIIYKKGGTLHRKKKVLYEEAKWVVLCVHNNRIPLLEWYFSEEYVHKHRPSKVVDLLDSVFVRVVISDPTSRSFMIGFVDCSRNPIELAALTADDCNDWIQATTSTLVRLKCLTESTNLYVSMSNFAAPTPKTAEQPDYEETDDDEVPEGFAPSPPVISSPMSSEYERLGLPSLATQTLTVLRPPQTPSAEEKKVKTPVTVKSAPPLPPRNPSSPPTQIPTVAVRHCSIYDHPTNHASTSSGEQPVMGRPEITSVTSHNSMYSSLEAPTSLDTEIVAPVGLHTELVKRGYSVPSGMLNVNITQPRRMTSDGSFSPNSDAICGSLNKISPVMSRVSEMNNQVVRNSSSAQSAENRVWSERVDDIDISNRLHTLAVQPIICTQHIAYAEFDGKVWLAGLSGLGEKNLADELHVGDQIVRINDAEIDSSQQIPSIFSAIPETGSLANLTLRQIPYGAVYTLQKTNEKFDAGFVLDNHKIKLADVIEGSAAWKTGIRATVPAVTRPGSAPTCITCINGHALNLFSKDDEIFKQIDFLPLLSTFTVIVQPYDFVKILKKNFKKLKSISDFLH